MTKREADIIGGLNMTDQISNEAYRQIMIAAEDEHGEWIPISEKQPEKYKKVLLTIHETTWDGKDYDYVICSVYPKKNAVAWMPMPEVWKGDQE